MMCRLNVKGIVAIKMSTVKKCKRIIRCIKDGEGGMRIDTSHPRGDSHGNWGCKILSLVPAAAKPVKRMTKRRNKGIKDELFLKMKNRVPASKASPSRSVKRDNIRAGMIGMVKPIWARIMTIIGTMKPQNIMRWALPGPGFFRIFLWSRM